MRTPRYLTLGAARDLSEMIADEARANTRDGFYADGNALENLRDDLDRTIAEAEAEGEQEIYVAPDSDLEAAADHHGIA